MRVLAAAIVMLIGMAGFAYGEATPGASEKAAQGMGSYSTMNFEAGYFQSDLNGRIDLMKDGVKIVLLP